MERDEFLVKSTDLSCCLFFRRSAQVDCSRESLVIPFPGLKSKSCGFLVVLVSHPACRHYCLSLFGKLRLCQLQKARKQLFASRAPAQMYRIVQKLEINEKGMTRVLEDKLTTTKKVASINC